MTKQFANTIRLLIEREMANIAQIDSLLIPYDKENCGKYLCDICPCTVSCSLDTAKKKLRQALEEIEHECKTN